MSIPHRKTHIYVFLINMKNKIRPVVSILRNCQVSTLFHKKIYFIYDKIYPNTIGKSRLFCIFI